MLHKPSKIQLKSAIIFSSLVVLVFVAVLNRSTIVNALTLATTHQSADFAELYFLTSKSNPLPTSSPVDQTKKFTFRIVNHSESTKTYTYIESITLNGQKTTLVTSKTVIRPMGHVDIDGSYVITTPQTKGVITISLPGHDQYISFRTES